MKLLIVGYHIQDQHDDTDKRTKTTHHADYYTCLISVFSQVYFNVQFMVVAVVSTVYKQMCYHLTRD